MGDRGGEVDGKKTCHPGCCDQGGTVVTYGVVVGWGFGEDGTSEREGFATGEGADDEGGARRAVADREDVPFRV